MTEKVEVTVIGLLIYRSFLDLYKDIPFSLIGRADRTLEWMVDETHKIYSQEKEAKYGALGIRFEYPC